VVARATRLAEVEPPVAPRDLLAGRVSPADAVAGRPAPATLLLVRAAQRDGLNGTGVDDGHERRRRAGRPAPLTRGDRRRGRRSYGASGWICGEGRPLCCRVAAAATGATSSCVDSDGTPAWARRR